MLWLVLKLANLWYFICLPMLHAECLSMFVLDALNKHQLFASHAYIGRSVNSLLLSHFLVTSAAVGLEPSTMG